MYIKSKLIHSMYTNFAHLLWNALTFIIIFNQIHVTAQVFKRRKTTIHLGNFQHIPVAAMIVYIRNGTKMLNVKWLVSSIVPSMHEPINTQLLNVSHVLTGSFERVGALSMEILWNNMAAEVDWIGTFD